VLNQFVVIRRNGENTATFKRLVELDGVRFLEAINPEWPERYIRLQEGDVFCGVVKTATLPALP
jgi:SOS-response transcriptional repressor LexA